MDCPYQFFVLESSLELYARHLLFLHIALEPKCRMGLQDKTELFLELFGNGLVRLQSMEYVRNLATEFIKMITDLDYLEKQMPFVDVSVLKFKERDLLEAIFKLWRNPDPSLFDFKKCWDLRLRKYLGERYDAIPNVFDWDFNMKLTEKGAGVIGTRHYNRWRQTGQAFEIREGAYDTVNYTLASGAVFNQGGERLARRGYWGDIVVSPYIAYGIESEEKSFFKTSNKMFTKSGEDVAEYNITAMLHEISNQEKYVAPTAEEEGVSVTGDEIF
ncbi:hypothetical protein CAPTEDRAFT_186529 [Capitella teleta]|uniref:Dynein assembly factor 3 C-terminal domain-containing protein n=1 Tax=Capitella teleta TaxID=283909 RepID=R7V1X0_CAPTE|nr:hypothetical protein CAPTEDRAFT_186529 [Capitella teleta]|eukprot:ELU12843.1 hypothetical protein CAPTEDRAFT_186529 [Capitella teleta]